MSDFGERILKLVFNHSARARNYGAQLAKDATFVEGKTQEGIETWSLSHKDKSRLLEIEMIHAALRHAGVEFEVVGEEPENKKTVVEIDYNKKDSINNGSRFFTFTGKDDLVQQMAGLSIWLDTLNVVGPSTGVIIRSNPVSDLNANAFGSARRTGPADSSLIPVAE